MNTETALAVARLKKAATWISRIALTLGAAAALIELWEQAGK